MFALQVAVTCGDGKIFKVEWGGLGASPVRIATAGPYSSKNGVCGGAVTGHCDLRQETVLAEK
jgi:hypothetical protein